MPQGNLDIGLKVGVLVNIVYKLQESALVNVLVAITVYKSEEDVYKCIDCHVPS